MNKLSHALRYLVLALLGAVWIIPLYLVLINSATDPKEYRKKAVYVAPKSFALWDNITAAWDAVNLGVSVGSTLFYATVGGALAVFLGSLAAFAIVNLRIKRGFFWFMVLYAGTIFPFQMYLAPLYTSYVKFNLYDTRQGLLIFYTAIAIPFAVFVVRNHFTSIPFDITEAAKIDGARAFRVYAQISLPLSVNAFLTVFILQFTWIWNDLLFGLTLSKSANIRPIMTALAGLQGQYASASIPVGLAGALALKPDVLVLDEPVSALDVSVQAQILNLLLDIKSKRSFSMIFISHDLAVIRNICDRVAVMYLGKIVEIGRTEDVYNTPHHHYTHALLGSVLAPGQKLPDKEVISGDLPSVLNPPSGCRFRTRCTRATERCAAETPALLESEPDHLTACHHPLGFSQIEQRASV